MSNQSHYGNVRNARTTHPRKTARRDRAYDRFSIDARRAASDPGYKARKEQEQSSLERGV